LLTAVRREHAHLRQENAVLGDKLRGIQEIAAQQSASHRYAAAHGALWVRP
jgi:hypothetical protein